MAQNDILAKVSVIINAQTAALGKDLKGAQSQISSFTKGITNLAGTIGLAFSVQQVASFGFEIAKLAGEVEGVKVAFDKLPDSERLMKSLKEATSDTVSELDLMKRTVQAANFGISLSALPKLLEFATLRAQQTGQSVDYLVDSIVTGIGRKSPLILDNLGISAVALRDKLDGVSAASATVGQVAEAVGKIAEENLNAMAGFSDNTKTSVEQLTAAWENFKASLGKNVAIGGGVKFLTELLETFTQSDDFKITAQVENLALALNAGEKTSTGFANAIKELADNGADLSITEKELSKILSRMKNAPLIADDLKNKLKEVGIEIINLNKTALGPQPFKFEDIFGKNGGEKTIGIIADLESRIKSLGDAMKDATSLGEISAFQKQIERAKNQLKDILKPPPEPVKIPVTFDIEEDLESVFKKIDIPPVVIDIDIPDFESTVAADKVIDNLKRIKDEARQLAEEFSGLVRNGIQNVLVSFAEDLGNAAAGVGNFGDNILQAVTSFAKQFGALLISAGLAKIAFEKLAVSGIGAVAAGVALIAAAGAVSAHIGKAKGALSGVSTSSSTSNDATNSSLGLRSAQNSSSVNFVIKGEDLWGTLNNYNRNNRSTSAIGG
jgi:hypothetical protein